MKEQILRTPRKTNFPDQFVDCVITNGEFSTGRRLRHYLDFTIGDLNFRNAVVLDVGAGKGLLSLAAASAGASVVALEPTGDGSTSTSSEVFRRLQAGVAGGQSVEFQERTIEEFINSSQDASRRFDIVVMADCINHLDEDAVVTADTDPRARAIFVNILAAVRDQMVPGGSLIVTDCARSNFFGQIGLTNPFNPAINWRLHQNPEFWCGVLGDAGFQIRSVEWSSPNFMGPVGSALLGNRFAAWLLRSHFRIHAVRRTRNSNGLT